MFPYFNRWTISNPPNCTFLNHILACKMLFHAKEHLEFTLALKMLPFGKYLALNTLYNKVSLLCNNLHTCLAKKTSLNCLKSLKPIPPTYFDKHKVLHLTRWALLDFSWCPYQNFLIIASIDIEALLFFSPIVQHFSFILIQNWCILPSQK